MRVARAAGVRFGMNVFVPDPAQLQPSPDGRGTAGALPAAALTGDARRYGVTVPPLMLDDDDGWQAQDRCCCCAPCRICQLHLRAARRPVVPALRKAGSTVLATVTSTAEAALAADRGADALVVQHGSAGAHSGAFLADSAPAAAAVTTAELVREVRAAVGLPLVAAGAVSDAAAVRSVLARRRGSRPGGHRPPADRRKRCAATAQGRPGGWRFTETQPDARVHRPLRAGPGQRLRPGPPGRPGGLPCHPPPDRPHPRGCSRRSRRPERLNLWAGKGWRQRPAGTGGRSMGALAGRVQQPGADGRRSGARTAPGPARPAAPGPSPSTSSRKRRTASGSLSRPLRRSRQARPISRYASSDSSGISTQPRSPVSAVRRGPAPCRPGRQDADPQPGGHQAADRV